MAKYIKNRVALAELETKAQEFINLSFDLCEQELRENRRNHTEVAVSRRNALQFASLSVQNSIKAFLTIVQIKPE